MEEDLVCSPSSVYANEDKYAMHKEGVDILAIVYIFLFPQRQNKAGGFRLSLGLRSEMIILGSLLTTFENM